MAITGFIYPASNQIEAFPVGFRGEGYPTSKYNTEHNLTTSSPIGGIKNNFCCIEKYDNDKAFVLVSIAGYMFRMNATYIKALLANKIDYYAGIELRNIGLNGSTDISLNTVGNVLAPIGYSKMSSSSTYEILDNNSYFEGLAFADADTWAKNTKYTVEDVNSLLFFVKVTDNTGEFIETQPSYGVDTTKLTALGVTGDSDNPAPATFNNTNITIKNSTVNLSDNDIIKLSDKTQIQGYDYDSTTKTISIPWLIKN